jgi:hypothetical protein
MEETLFQSEEEYLLYCNNEESEFTEMEEYDDEVIVYNGEVIEEGVINIKYFTQLIDVVEKNVAHRMYDTLYDNKSFLYPGWHNPCGFVILIHAWELLNDRKWDLGSLIDIWNPDHESICRLGDGLQCIDIYHIATAIGISFLMYIKSENVFFQIGEGEWVDNFWVYEGDGHFLPISEETTGLGWMVVGDNYVSTEGRVFVLE